MLVTPKALLRNGRALPRLRRIGKLGMSAFDPSGRNYDLIGG